MCDKYGSSFFETPLEIKVGISFNVKEGIEPIHGLRHFPTKDTSGWYIWAGDYSDDPDFF
ncbi:immunity protein Imm33 domain-containing protein [Kordia jejudonensis]